MEMERKQETVQKLYKGGACRANGVDDPAFSSPHWVVIISNHNVGVLTVHKMNYSSFPLHWRLLVEIAFLRHALFT